MRLVAAAFGLGIMACVDFTSAEDSNSVIPTWLEATWEQDTVLAVRAIGAAGCGGLEEIGIEFDESEGATVLIVHGRIRPTDGNCIAPVYFDTTILVASDRLRARVQIFTGFGRAAGEKYVEIDRSGRANTPLWFGGYASIDSVISGCQLLQVDTGLGPKRILPATNIARLRLRPGEFVFVQGRQFSESVTCGEAGSGVWIDLIRLRPGRSQPGPRSNTRWGRVKTHYD